LLWRFLGSSFFFCKQSQVMGSCFSKVGIIIPPHVEVSNINFRGAGPISGVSCDAVLSITNPNPGQLTCKTFTYKVVKKSDQTLLTEGNGKSFIAPGNNKATEVVTPVNFALGGIGAAGKSLLFRGRTDLVVSGSLVFEAPLTKEGSVAVPFRGEETIIIQ
jgi:hypothetical protein